MLKAKTTWAVGAAVCLVAGALWVGLPYPGRYVLVHVGRNESYRMDRMTGRTWLVTYEGVQVLKELP